MRRRLPVAGLPMLQCRCAQPLTDGVDPRTPFLVIEDFLRFCILPNGSKRAADASARMTASLGRASPKKCSLSGYLMSLRQKSALRVFGVARNLHHWLGRIGRSSISVDKIFSEGCETRTPLCTSGMCPLVAASWSRDFRIRLLSTLCNL